MCNSNSLMCWAEKLQRLLIHAKHQAHTPTRSTPCNFHFLRECIFIGFGLVNFLKLKNCSWWNSFNLCKSNLTTAGLMWKARSAKARASRFIFRASTKKAIHKESLGLKVERATGFEPATSTLGKLHSTSWVTPALFCKRSISTYSSQALTHFFKIPNTS